MKSQLIKLNSFVNLLFTTYNSFKLLFLHYKEGFI